MSNNIVVVYFSGYGHTQKIPEAVASGAQARVLRVDQEANLPEAQLLPDQD